MSIRGEMVKVLAKDQRVLSLILHEAFGGDNVTANKIPPVGF